MMDSGWYFGGGFMWIFWIILIMVLILIIKGVMGTNPVSKMSDTESPLDILKKRYARGEIDEDEYHKRRKDLEN